MTLYLFETIGWLGTGTYLVAYGLLSAKIIRAEALYYRLNILGASGIVVVSWAKGTWQAVAINVLWIVLSLYGLLGKSPPVRAVSPRGARGVVAVVAAAALAAFSMGSWHLGIELLGWVSFLAFFLGYALFVSGRISQREFHVWNLVAPTVLLPELWVHRNAPVFVLEAVWALSAAVGLWRGENDTLGPP